MDRKVRIKNYTMKRKFHKDCILKKIKSRYFKYFANKHIKIFIEKLNNKKLFNEFFEFHRIEDFVIEDITLKRNYEWDFINKSAFDLFHDYSNSFKNKPIYNMYKNEKEKFNQLIDCLGLESLTKIIVLKTTSEVFDHIINDNKLFNYFLDKVKTDIARKVSDRIYLDYYITLFKKTLTNFIGYYEKPIETTIVE